MLCCCVFGGKFVSERTPPPPVGMENGLAVPPAAHTGGALPGPPSSQVLSSDASGVGCPLSSAQMGWCLG